jgi:hypothetical protein
VMMNTRRKGLQERIGGPKQLSNGLGGRRRALGSFFGFSTISVVLLLHPFTVRKSMASPSPRSDRFKKGMKRIGASLRLPSRSQSRNTSPVPSTEATPSQTPSSSHHPSSPNRSSSRPLTFQTEASAPAIPVVNVGQTASGDITTPSALYPTTGSTKPPPPSSAGGPDRGIARSDVAKGIAIFRTLLNVAEKALDGLPIWGPKAGVGVTSEVLKSIQVRECKISVLSPLINAL